MREFVYIRKFLGKFLKVRRIVIKKDWMMEFNCANAIIIDVYFSELYYPKITIHINIYISEEYTSQGALAGGTGSHLNWT